MRMVISNNWLLVVTATQVALVTRVLANWIAKRIVVAAAEPKDEAAGSVESLVSQADPSKKKEKDPEAEKLA